MGVDKRQHIEEEKISLAGLVRNVHLWIKDMLGAWKKIALGTIIIGAIYFAYQELRRVNFTAETTFVLETQSGSGLGQVASLASLTGVNLSALTEGSSLFQLDNIIELYRSFTMMKETLLTRNETAASSERLITWYGREMKLDKGWEQLGIDFEIPNEQLIVKHDSVLKEVVMDIRDRNLAVAKASRKLSILRVAYTSGDELFAKRFNEVLVAHVNEFYLRVKTRKTGENLRVLNFQADSVKKVVDQVLLDLATFEEQNPNLNPLRALALVPRQKIQIDLQASSAVYQEIVKNLEIAKVAHRNNMPLIQIIDQPILPLEDDQMKWYKALVIGLFLGGVLMVGYLTLKRIYVSIMEENKLINFT